MKNKFIRYGGLSKVKQKERYGSDTFHAPPSKKGIYAFPYGLIDKFLLGASNDPQNISGKSYYIKDDNNNKIKDNDFWNPDYEGYEYNTFDAINKKYHKIIKKRKIKLNDIFSVENKKDKEFYICTYKKPKYFEYDGIIWSHLKDHLKPEHIISENGSWVKTTMEDYLMAFEKEKHQLRKEKIKVFGLNYKNTNPFKNINTDHLEVFIEKIN